jgi:hypothetical protein
MPERTRLPAPELDSAGVFAQYVQDWMDCYGPLIEAAGTLRLDQSEPEALTALLASSPVRRLTAAWELWEVWTGATGATTDRQLGAHLGTETSAWIRFALWG